MFARLLDGHQGYCQAGNRRVGIEQVKMLAPKLIFLTEIQSFLLNKCSLNYCEPLVNFQGSEKVDSDNFC